jgi:hypothetical protein
MASDPPSKYREAMSHHEKCIRDLAHEVGLAAEHGTVPPSVFAALGDATADCGAILEHYRGQRIPSDLQKTVGDVQRIIGDLARALDRLKKAGR